MSGNYPYYNDGFFGFGSPGSFKPYSLMHLAPIALCIAAILFVYYKRDGIRNWKNEATFRYVLSFSMFLMEYGFFVWLLYVGDSSGDYLMMAKLPLHLCDIGLISCMYMIISKNESLFGFNYYVTLFGATLACIIPQTVLNDVDPSYFRYYQYFGEHLIPVFCTAYMMIVHNMRPRYRDIWISIVLLCIMVIPAISLNNAFPGADYLFLKLDISIFPVNQYYRALIYAGLLVVIFHLMLMMQRLIAKINMKEVIDR
ncbi:MAG: TIGR02206 family membrane protein [Mogibacterium sp.]|nr:TIGR02206 family membrane protein [Mogibacterium sp.]